MPFCNMRESCDVNKCVLFSQGGSGRLMLIIDNEPIINIGGKNLRRVSKTKSLGILIDEKFKLE